MQHTHTHASHASRSREMSGDPDRLRQYIPRHASGCTTSSYCTLTRPLGGRYSTSSRTYACICMALTMHQENYITTHTQRIRRKTLIRYNGHQMTIILLLPPAPGFNGIADQGAASLARGLTRNGSLRTLYLSGNSIGAMGAGSLAEALGRNMGLSTLHLSVSEKEGVLARPVLYDGTLLLSALFFCVFV